MHQRVIYSTKHISEKVCQFTVPTWSHRLIMLYILFSLAVHFCIWRVYMTRFTRLLYLSIILYVRLSLKWLFTYLSLIYINKYMNTHTSKYFTSEVLKGVFLPFSSVSNVLNLSFESVSFLYVLYIFFSFVFV